MGAGAGLEETITLGGGVGPTITVVGDGWTYTDCEGGETTTGAGLLTTGAACWTGTIIVWTGGAETGGGVIIGGDFTGGVIGGAFTGA